MPAPTPNQPDEIIRDADLYLAFQLMKRKDFDAAEKHLLTGIKKARRLGDTTLEGLYLSAMGVLYKLKQDFKRSYKFYQQAERLLGEDGSLKIISSLLLIEQFGQHDTAARKLDKVIERDGQDPAMLHHAKAIQGVAYFRMGKRDKARENMEFLLAQDFLTLRSAANLDFKLVELFLKKNFFADLCRKYLEKALDLAKKKREKVFEQVIAGILEDLSKVIKSQTPP
jgi:tetratricopeptide (TPR) repeat protein